MPGIAQGGLRGLWCAPLDQCTFFPPPCTETVSSRILSCRGSVAASHTPPHGLMRPWRVETFRASPSWCVLMGVYEREVSRRGGHGEEELLPHPAPLHRMMGRQTDPISDREVSPSPDVERGLHIWVQNGQRLFLCSTALTVPPNPHLPRPTTTSTTALPSIHRTPTPLDSATPTQLPFHSSTFPWLCFPSTSYHHLLPLPPCSDLDSVRPPTLPSCPRLLPPSSVLPLCADGKAQKSNEEGRGGR